MKRAIIEIDESACDGCGLCATGCPEGAIQIIEGKARLVGEGLCDGLGACIGECPRGAITTVEREAEAYDEARVMANLAPKGAAVIAAHLRHLSSHGQDEWHRQALAWLAARGMTVPEVGPGVARGVAGGVARGVAGGVAPGPAHGGCPGSAQRAFTPRMASAIPSDGGARASFSALAQWPVQLTLVNPCAPFFRDADVLVAADCTAFACGGFHEELLAGKALVIACPKLDNKEGYVEKLRAIVDEGLARSLTVAIMEVPCCSGLVKIVKEAMASCTRAVPVSVNVVSIQGGGVRAAS